jgi:hypothetical protein
MTGREFQRAGEKFFNPFYYKIAGTGLGWQLARRVAEFGGKVDWESPCEKDMEQIPGVAADGEQGRTKQGK